MAQIDPATFERRQGREHGVERAHWLDPDDWGTSPIGACQTWMSRAELSTMTSVANASDVSANVVTVNCVR